MRNPNPTTPTTPVLATKRKATPLRRQSEPISSGDAPLDSSATKKPIRESRCPRAKLTKRESKHVPAPSNSVGQTHLRDLDLLAVPDSFWLQFHNEENAEAPLHLRHWFSPELSISSVIETPQAMVLSREERLEGKIGELRRKASQLRRSQKYRSAFQARRRLLLVQATLLQEEQGEEVGLEMMSAGKACSVDSCPNEALLFSTLCAVHVAGTEDEKLFAPCIVDQCKRVPVFDLRQEKVFCREHLSSSKERLVVAKGKSSSAVGVKAARKATPAVTQRKVVDTQQVKRIAVQKLPPQNQPTKQLRKKESGFVEERDDEEDDSDSLLNHGSRQSTSSSETRVKSKTVVCGRNGQTDLLLVSENSSAYESSEDTGVGGLSESEMIGEFG